MRSDLLLGTLLLVGQRVFPREPLVLCGAGGPRGPLRFLEVDLLVRVRVCAGGAVLLSPVVMLIATVCCIRWYSMVLYGERNGLL